MRSVVAFLMVLLQPVVLQSWSKHTKRLQRSQLEDLSSCHYVACRFLVLSEGIKFKLRESWTIVRVLLAASVGVNPELLPHQ